MGNILLAASLNENLQEIVTKLQELMDSFWLYIVLALAAVVVVWGAYVGIRIAVAHRQRRENQREGHGEVARDRYRDNLRCGYGRAASYQRFVGVGRYRRLTE